MKAKTKKCRIALSIDENGDFLATSFDLSNATVKTIFEDLDDSLYYGSNKVHYFVEVEVPIPSKNNPVLIGKAKRISKK